ncbi:MAG TPA: ABC transporter substrate-binding protein [Verrucomicrobiae bacterium]|nr:ABC transporter substrate-binding protein [Verrucomicrobiae bacterium]
MKIRNQQLFAVSATAISLLLAGCNKSSPSAGAGGDVIKIGEYASLTGSEATFGQQSHNGTQLAIDDINAAGGVLGKKIELLTEDDQSQAGQSATVVRKLISSDGVVAILGEVASSRSLEAAPICQENKIPMITPASTNPKVTQTGDYIFRTCFLDSFQGQKVLADFARDTLKLKSVAVLRDVKSDYSVGLAKFFEDGFTARGGKIILEQNYSGGDKDFNAQLTAIKAANPDGIFVPGYYTEVGLIALQARQLGINVPLFGGDGWMSFQLVPIGGAALEGDYFSTHFTPDQDSPVVQNFVQKYRQKYNDLPDCMAALGYDSAMILADAIKRAGSTDPAKIRDAIAATKDFPGVTGNITIDAERNASKPAIIVTIKDGRFKYVETIAP